jgi:phytoene dehydrogenase-like protein
MNKKIIIIGGGIAGLTAGILGQINGYQTHIFEQHNMSGGLCTSWKKKGYTFDGCIKYLYGSRSGKSFSKIMTILGILPDIKFYDHDEIVHIENREEKTLILYSNLDQLKEHLLTLAPTDSKLIKSLIRAADRFARIELPTNIRLTLIDFFHMMRLLPTLIKWTKISLQEFCEQIQDPFLHEAFMYIYNYAHLPDLPMSAVLINLANHHNHNAGMPFGGSQKVVKAIEKHYFNLGGHITYQAKVDKILVEDEKACGILLENGEKHYAATIISASDGHATIFGMLGGKYIDTRIQNLYKQLYPVNPIVQISFGIKRDFSGYPWALNYPLKEPIQLAGSIQKRLSLYIFNQDHEFTPEGCSIIEVIFESNYEYWKLLASNPEKYQAEKDNLINKVIDLLEQRFPGIKQQIDVIDVATPLTFERYTDNFQGSPQGWKVTKDTMRLKLSNTLPGLNNFYMAGQWVEMGGGIPGAARSGTKVIRMICKRDKHKFITS